MKRPLYYLLCAIACTPMIGTTMPMAAIAEAIQPQETAEQQAQADAMNSDTGKAEDGTKANATADTAEDGTATSTGTSQTDPADANATDTTTPGTAAVTTTPTPSLLAQTNSTPEAISTTSQTTYARSATASQNGVTFTVSWNDAPAGTATTFHVTQANGSSQAKARMDVPTYWDGGSQESVCDPSRPAWASYCSLGTTGHDFTFDFTASGTYRIHFYFMDNDRDDPQNDKGIYYLRTTAEVTVNDAARPSVTQIVNNAVAQCRQETNGSEYDMALWLHDWTLDQLEYDHSLNWCSAESGLTRHQGTCESYQRIYSKLLNAAGIANGRITGNGHTWNAVKIDGKWCQMDLTWDDTSGNWYGDLDQRHLYFGLTDELMAIAHSDHTANYQKADYAYRSTDLSNNYFMRNGKADEWAEKYADRVQQHLDAKEESFSIDADNQSFPPSISGIQNGIVAFAMNQREWKANDEEVKLLATPSFTKVSNSKWCAKYHFNASYQTKTIPAVLPDGDYRLSTSLNPGLALCPDGSSAALTSWGRVLSLARDASSGLYRITAADGSELTYKGGRVSFSPEGEGAQLWLVRADLDGYALLTADGSMALDVPGASASDGAELQLFAANGTRAQRWKASGAPARTLPDGDYRLSTSLNPGLALCPDGSSAALTSWGRVLSLARDASSGLYRITAADGSELTYKGGRVSFSPEGEGAQLWLVRADLDGYALLTADGSMALDVPGASASDGAELQLFAANGTRAQRWKASGSGKGSTER